MSKKNKNITLLVICNFECSQNCVFCSTNDLQGNKSKTTEQIMKIMKDGKKNGYENVEFSGGEVTIRKDIFDLVRSAKDLGYKNIGMVSNGRMFFYRDFCRVMMKSGLNYVLISLHGHNKRIQEGISCTPGSFDQSVAGIKNLVKLKMPIAVSTAINKLNYRHLEDLGKFINELGVRYWMISDLIPEGGAKNNYEFLSVSYGQFLPELKKIGDLSHKFNRVHFWYFPLCVFPIDFFSNKNIFIIDSKSRREKVKQTGYGPRNLSFREETDRIYDKYRIFTKECEKCRFLNNCGGFFEAYIGKHPVPIVAEYFIKK